MYPNKSKVPAEAHSSGSYSHAITDAVYKADRRRKKLAGEGSFTPLPHWYPNQLRHTFATDVRKRHGLEAAQVLFGHSKADVTDYASSVHHRQGALIPRRTAAAVRGLELPRVGAADPPVATEIHPCPPSRGLLDWTSSPAN